MTRREAKLIDRIIQFLADRQGVGQRVSFSLITVYLNMNYGTVEQFCADMEADNLYISIHQGECSLMADGLVFIRELGGYSQEFRVGELMEAPKRTE